MKNLKNVRTKFKKSVQKNQSISNKKSSSVNHDTKVITSTLKKNKNNKNRYRHNIMVGLKSAYLFFLVICLIIGVSAFAFTYQSIVTLPNSLNVDTIFLNELSTFYDINGEVIDTIGVNSEKRQSITYDEINEIFIDAVLATEDERFYSHNGVDYPRLVGATLSALKNMNTDGGGGSSITMQLSKTLFTSMDTTIERKVRDMYISTTIIEKNLSKEEIFELYVNNQYFGQGAHGIALASKVYFNKTPQRLNLAEASFLAGLFQSPNSYDPLLNGTRKAEIRRNNVLYYMHEAGFITKEEMEVTQKIPLKSYLNPTKITSENYHTQDIINYAVKEIENKTGLSPYTTTMEVHTTMVPEVQEHLSSVRYDKNNFPDEKIILASTILNTKTGSISGIIDGREPTPLGFSYASAKTHPGSTFKPIADYGPCFEYGGCNSTTENIIDEAITYQGGQPLKNFDLKYQGVISIERALNGSRNTSALRAFRRTSNANKIDFIKGLGIEPEIGDNGILYESVSVGAFNPGASTVEMAGAYAAFGSGGNFTSPYLVTEITYQLPGEKEPLTVSLKPETDRAMSANTAYQINSILENADVNGFFSRLAKYKANYAAKSGTSTWNDGSVRERWNVVYTPEYTTAMWVGYNNYSNDYKKNGWVMNKFGVGDSLRLMEKVVTGNFQPQKYSSFPDKTGSFSSITVEANSYPMQLVNEYTPSSIKVKKISTIGKGKAIESSRWNPPFAPTNLSISKNNRGVEVSWAAAPPPTVYTDEYLDSIFNSNYFDSEQAIKQHKTAYLNELKQVYGSLVYEYSVTTNKGFQYSKSISNSSTNVFITNDELLKMGNPSQIRITLVNKYQYGPESDVVSKTISIKPQEVIKPEPDPEPEPDPDDGDGDGDTV